MKEKVDKKVKTKRCEKCGVLVGQANAKYCKPCSEIARLESHQKYIMTPKLINYLEDK